MMTCPCRKQKNGNFPWKKSRSAMSVSHVSVAIIGAPERRSAKIWIEWDPIKCKSGENSPRFLCGSDFYCFLRKENTTDPNCRFSNRIHRYQPFSDHPIVISILPVSVVISHLPPLTLSGTLTRPVWDLAKNIFSESKFPLTLPVLVLTKISAASESSNFTLPVLLSIENFSEAIT